MISLSPMIRREVMLFSAAGTFHALLVEITPRHAARIASEQSTSMALYGVPPPFRMRASMSSILMPAVVRFTAHRHARAHAAPSADADAHADSGGITGIALKMTIRDGLSKMPTFVAFTSRRRAASSPLR